MISQTPSNQAPLLSVVVPVHNEAENVPALLAEILAALGEFGAFEIIYVDDGSTDETGAILATLAAREPRLRVVRHDVRAGQSAGLHTGVAAARGQWIATLDGDCQNDPADIPRLWNALQLIESRDSTVLQGQRRRRMDSLVRRVSSRVANGVRAALLNDRTPDVGCGLKLFRRDAFLALPFFDHMHRFLPALFQRAGQTVISVPVSHRPRFTGRSHYGLHNRLWVGITDLLGVLWLTRRMVSPRISARPLAAERVDRIPTQGPSAAATPAVQPVAGEPVGTKAQTTGAGSFAAFPQTGFLVFIAWALLTAISLATRPLLPIDETRYLSVAWEMWLRHDWLVPHLNGVPYSDKPPLLFWLVLSGWKIFGVSEVWPRLVGPLISLAALFASWRLSLRLWPGRADIASNGMVIGLGTILWMLYGGLVLFDSLLALCVLIGMIGLVGAARKDGAGSWVMFGLGLGAGILAKGPVVLIHLLPAFLLGPWWASPASGRPRQMMRWYGFGGAAILGGVAIALAWALPAANRGGSGYTQEIFLSQTSGRIVSAFAHRRPVWWYLPLLPLLFSPWFFLPGLWRGLRRTFGRSGEADSGSRFCLAWLAPAVTGFSLISGKQMHYLFPLVPPFALLAGRVMADTAAAMQRDRAANEHEPGLINRREAAGPLKTIAAATINRRDLAGSLKTIAAATILGFVIVQAAVFHFIGNRYNLHPVAEHLREIETEGRPIAHVGKYSGQYHFLGRLKKPFDVITAPEVTEWLKEHPGGAVVNYTHTSPPHLGHIPNAFVQQYEDEFVIVSGPGGQPHPRRL